jgi:hypothetical protein
MLVDPKGAFNVAIGLSKAKAMFQPTSCHAAMRLKKAC